MSGQVESGKSFEYALALAIAHDDASIITQSAIACGYHDMLSASAKANMRVASYKVVDFLSSSGVSLIPADQVCLQMDKAGVKGDVRDIVVQSKGRAVGLSSKHHHWAVKHSRLSDRIDFGKEWAGLACSAHYFDAIRPVFADLRDMQQRSMLFRDILGKEARIYLPILIAFEDEMRRLSEDYRELFVPRLFQYIIGNYDFYKVVLGKNHVSVQSVNIGGTLEWGRRWRVPHRIELVSRKRGTNNTVLVSFTGGWQLSFRIHNASSRVEPSLKFDIQFVGMPQDVGKHDISLEHHSDEQ